MRLRFQSGAIYRWDLEHRGKTANIDVPGPVTFNTNNLIVQGALAGIGIAWVAQDQVAERLDSGSLVQILADWSPPFPGFCL